MTVSKLAISLLAVFGAASALAQSAPNPLMRPVPPTAGAAAGAPRAPSMPPVPGMVDAFGRNDKSDERVRAVQTALSRFNVVAIHDDTAILRVTTVDSQSSGPASLPASQGEASGGVSAGAGAAKDVVYGVLPSMVVKHKQKLMLQDVEALVDVHGGEVRIQSADGTRALYQGRLDGNSSKVYRGFALTPTDSAYTNRQSPPVGTSAAVTASGAASGAQGRSGSGQTQF